jgi:hypothetical protein
MARLMGWCECGGHHLPGGPASHVLALVLSDAEAQCAALAPWSTWLGVIDSLAGAGAEDATWRVDVWSMRALPLQPALAAAAAASAGRVTLRAMPGLGVHAAREGGGGREAAASPHHHVLLDNQSTLRAARSCQVGGGALDASIRVNAHALRDLADAARTAVLVATGVAEHLLEVRAVFERAGWACANEPAAELAARLLREARGRGVSGECTLALICSDGDTAMRVIAAVLRDGAPWRIQVWSWRAGTVAAALGRLPADRAARVSLHELDEHRAAVCFRA